MGQVLALTYWRRRFNFNPLKKFVRLIVLVNMAMLKLRGGNVDTGGFQNE